jgi:hypothetical protein
MTELITEHWKNMASKSYYTIQQYWEYPDKPEHNKWASLTSFSYMQKSFAEGAWAMLRAHYNQTHKHRLLKDGEVIEECGYQKVGVNLN